MSAIHYLTNAHDLNIGSININHVSSSSHLDQHLCNNIAIDAVHNSAERHDAPKCHKDTRKAVQEEIHGWISDGDEDIEPMRILHLTGPAGTGKTAIAGSIADTCDEEGLLAGSFFFASFTASETRRSKCYLVATLTYHLIFPLDVNNPLRCAILLAVQKDPSIFKRRLKDQFKFLLVKPFTDTRNQFDTSILPKVFIIDGLDEVEGAKSRKSGRDLHEVRLENEADQREILDALLSVYTATGNSSAFPFRIIVASRPERVIETFFQDHANHVTRKIFLDDKYDPDSDITLFLNAKFTEIRRRYRLPASWPSGSDIWLLVKKASGQFVYAATVIRFLQSGKHPNPKALLKKLLNWRIRGSEIDALAPLDFLYMRILQSSPDPSMVGRWIWVIDYLYEENVRIVNQLLEDYEGQAEYLLENLASLVWIPPVEAEDLPESQYQFHHKSFRDFLLDTNRCGQELGFAFIAGKDFFAERCINILIDKSPAVAIPEPEHTTFIEDFIRTTLNKYRDLIKSPLCEVLARCDAVWWVAEAEGHPGFYGAEVPARWFHDIHQACPPASPSHCLPHCKHWRSNILRVMKGLGYSVPNVVALFRAALIPTDGMLPELKMHHHDQFFVEYFYWPESSYRSTEEEQSEPSDRSTGEDSEEQPQSTDRSTWLTQYTIDAEYQATLDLLSAMISALPAGWQRRLLEDMVAAPNPFMPWRGWTDIIAEMKQELGIEAPDVRVFPQWDVVFDRRWDNDSPDYYRSEGDDIPGGGDSSAR